MMKAVAKDLLRVLKSSSAVAMAYQRYSSGQRFGITDSNTEQSYGSTISRA